MSTISLDDIQRDPAKFVGLLEAGESLVVLKGNRAVAEVKPLPGNRSVLRPFGLAAGEFVVPDDFDQPLPDAILDGFEGATPSANR